MNPSHAFSLIEQWTPELLAAAGQTLRMTAFAYVLGAVAGLIIALGGLSRHRTLPTLCRVYIEFIRGTPTLTQLFLNLFWARIYQCRHPEL